MAILPVWIWTVARAAEKGRAVRVFAAAAALLGGVAFATALPRVGEAPDATPVRVSAVLERSTGPRDVVVAGTAFYLPLRLAKDRGALRASLDGFPSDLEHHPGWFEAKPAPDAAYAELDARLAKLADEKGSRAWIVVHPLFKTPKLAQTLEERGSTETALSVPDALVLVWTPRRAGP
jgi:hypothetical protein